MPRSHELIRKGVAHLQAHALPVHLPELARLGRAHVQDAQAGALQGVRAVGRLDTEGEEVNTNKRGFGGDMGINTEADGLLNSVQVETILNSGGGRKLIRERLLQICGGIFKEMFASQQGQIEIVANDAVERACKRALEEGWKTEHGHETVERVVRRMVEDLVTKRVSQEYEVFVSVEIRKRSVTP
jgi:hypothetical protein